ncbi:MAG: hypothetical protein LBV68_08025 [Spirochaetaceae bacterium]|jgi:hypothetical protein|nr:hypothetical protein [Spirochaetaceae bacterium]
MIKFDAGKYRVWIFCFVMASALIGLNGCASSSKPGATETITDSLPPGANSEMLFSAFETAFTDVFRKYHPITKRLNGTVTGTAAYGKYPISFTLTYENNNYTIYGESSLRKKGYLNKWIQNVHQRTNNYLAKN